MIGTKLGPYEITAKLGEGGMGEVYRATDTKLGRDVAIKVLPAELAGDPERLARFEREAKLLASLNHPNIAHVYGFEAATLEDGKTVSFLAMELVDGEDLAERLKRGAIPVDEALEIARQIAEALEEAHQHGIVHRDLKPANVKVAPDGKVKVLDFGLAKAYAGEAASGSAPELSQSPTLAHTGTQAGIILGTAAYMSPEQARGKPLDKRADIWAFGVLLYEMLTGRQLFAGETVSDVLAAVLTRDPDYAALPARTSPAIQRLLRSCLERNPRERLRDIGDARLALRDVGASSEATGDTAPAGFPSRVRRAMLAAGLALAVISLVAGFVAGRGWPTSAPATASRPTARFEIATPQGLALPDGVQGALAIAPDDRAIVFVAGDADGRRLYMRYLPRTEVAPIPGTEGAADPFFSPDGRWVAFFANGHLKKVSLVDGTVVEVPLSSSEIAAVDDTGGCWAPDGTIVFAPSYSGGLVTVPADGGPVRALTTRNAAAGEASHDWPDLLPDGEHVLYTIEHTGRPFDEAAIAVVSLRTGKSKVVLQGGTAARYSSGHLVYGRGSRLLTVPFDPKRLEVTGEVSTVVDGVAAETGRGRTDFAVSRAGSIVFAPGTLNAYPRDLLWAARDGTLTPASPTRRAILSMSLAPDAERALVEIQGSDDDLWLLDLTRDAATRLTFGNESTGPAWAPDGKRFVWSSDRAGPFNLYLGSVDEPARAERLAPSEQAQGWPSWAPDGSRIVYEQDDPATQGDIWMLALDGDRRPRALVKTSFHETAPSLSPDGRWLAYASDESGRTEIYVQAFPGPLPRRQASGGRGAGLNGRPQVSAADRTITRWSRDGHELFYWDGDRLMSVTIKPGAALDVGLPRVVLEMRTAYNYFDVAPDGRFLVVRDVAPVPLTRLVVAVAGALEIGQQRP
jgi:Tol biopolymer transport system component